MIHEAQLREGHGFSRAVTDTKESTGFSPRRTLLSLTSGITVERIRITCVARPIPLLNIDEPCDEAQAFDSAVTNNTVGAPSFAYFCSALCEGWERECSLNATKDCIGGIATRPCENARTGHPPRFNTNQCLASVAPN